MHFLNVIKQYFYPRTILDIGANVGEFYVYAKTIFDKSYIFCIEANENCVVHLASLTDQYKISLLAKDDSEYEFYGRKNNPVATGNSIYKENTEFYSDDELTVSKKMGTPLDKLFPGQFMFDLIKIDTQGSELDIIKGGINLCSRALGMLVEVSVEPYNTNAPLKSEVVEYMEQIGFSPVHVLEYINNPVTQTVAQENILFLNKKHFNI